MKNRKPINKISKRRQKQIEIYRLEKEIYLKENPICQAKVKCYGSPSQDIHHKKGRIEELLFDKNYFLAVCRSCHNWIEANPTKAKEKGFSLNRL